MFTEDASTRVLSSTAYTLTELLEAFKELFNGDEGEVKHEFIAYWTLPAGREGVMELVCFPKRSIKFWAISEVSELVLASKMPPGKIAISKQ